MIEKNEIKSDTALTCTLNHIQVVNIFHPIKSAKIEFIFFLLFPVVALDDDVILLFY